MKGRFKKFAVLGGQSLLLIVGILLVLRSWPRKKAALNVAEITDPPPTTSSYRLKEMRDEKALSFSEGVTIRQKASFRETYLTLVSIVQGVAVGYLALVILHEYADLLVLQEQWNALLSLTKTALRLAPNDREWLAKQQLGQAKLLEVSETKEQWLEAGDTYYDAKQYKEAIAAYSRAIQLYPRCVYAYYRRGLVYAQLKKYQEAINNYDCAVALNPNFFLAKKERQQALCFQKGISPTGKKYVRSLTLLGMLLKRPL